MLVLALFNGHNGNSVEVRVDGEIQGIYSLSENQTIEINGTGGHNTLIIENGKALMKDADCPDQLCVRQGEISLKGQSIICLPHKVAAEITDADNSDFKSESDIDIIVK